MREHYIYRHIRLDKNVPFYIGIGTNPENCSCPSLSFRRAYNFNARSVAWKNIFSRTAVEVEIIYTSSSYDEIKYKETEFIKLYGQIIRGQGTLINLTDGGDGTLGRVHSEESKKKTSASLKGRSRPLVDLFLNLQKRKCASLNPKSIS